MKRTISLLLALGMFATMLAPSAAAEEVTPENAETAAVAELVEEAAPEIETAEDNLGVALPEAVAEEDSVAEETSVDETTASAEVTGQPAEEVSAEVSGAAGDVAINATNFPDANFRKYIEDTYDSDGDKVITATQIAGITSIYWPNSEIESMKGIEFFTNLNSLEIGSPKLATLDVSKNTALTSLSCHNTKLTALDISQNTALTRLYCSNNKLTSLDVSKNTALTSLNCSYNFLTNLDVSKSSELTGLDCSHNNLTSLKLGEKKELAELDCSVNKITEVDVSDYTKLTKLNCSYNKLTSLDVSKNVELGTLYCHENELTALDISKNIKLTAFGCSGNKMAMFDMTDYPQIMYPSVGNQKLDVELKHANGRWQCDVKELVGAGNFALVSNVKGYGATYNEATGIISFPGTTSGYVSFDYDYNTNKLREDLMHVTVSATIKDATVPAAPVTGDPVKTAAFVDRLYMVCLNRTADAAGKADWTSQLTGYRISGTKSAYGFVFSKEFQNKKYSNEDYVEQLYAALMGRKSDATGKAYWVSRLNAGASREEVFYGFADSNEFNSLCNSYGIVAKDIETFVTRFYKVCLNRAPDAGGLADWSSRLRGKTSTGRDVGYGFVFSKEFQNKKYSNENYVEQLYASFLGRTSDAIGKAYWVSRLKSGASREEVFDGFVGSKEFSDICASYDIARG